MIGEVYDIYQRDLVRMNAMDFDDLLFRTVNLLELFEDARERYRDTFRHVLVDEYQDTNHAQYRLLQLLAGGGAPPKRGAGSENGAPAYSGPVGHRNLAVVGDDAQCLLAGTQIKMADGSERPIERVRVGDRVQSCFGSGNLRASEVTEVFEAHNPDGIRIRMTSGREIVSTPEHTHFAGYRPGLMPAVHATYVLRKRTTGWRVGTTRTIVSQAGKALAGLQFRTMTEQADDAWVVSTHDSPERARMAESILSARYGLPMVPFRARGTTGVLGDQGLIDRVYAEVDTDSGGHRLLDDEGHFPGSPHHVWRGFEGRRRVVTLTLAADRSGADKSGAPLHTLSLGGRDADLPPVLLELGLKVAAPRPGSSGWRSETYFHGFGEAALAAQRLAKVAPVALRHVARLGKPERGRTNALPFMPASSIHPGMVMFDEAGRYDTVASVERVSLDSPVYDINVADTHNFVANGLVTHNSIYGFRGADIENILRFQDDFGDARVVKLEQNYRSTETILSAANAVIANNRGQIGKRLWSELGQGEQIQARALGDEHAEARYVVGEIQRLVDEGASRAEIAVLYRTNAMSRVIEDNLVRSEIGYQVIGGTKFYERAEIKDAIAYLTLLANPYDVVSFTRVANSPRRGIGATTLARVTAHAAAMDSSVWEAAASPRQVPGLGAAAVKALGRFMATMAELRAMTGAGELGGEKDDLEDGFSQLETGTQRGEAERGSDGVPIAELLEAVLAQTGYIEALEAERSIEAQGRIENLEQLVEVGREFDGSEGEDTLERFLQEIALVADADGRSDDEGLVTLMTLHNAKGLEYPTVFITGLEDGVFPHSRAIDEGGLEEERRLFYVGVTRAMRKLYLTHARRRAVFGAQSYGMPSRFLAEIPGDLLEEGGDFPSAAAYTPSLARGAATSWSAPSPGRREPLPAEEIQAFRLGEDVVHAAFGDGVVTAVEPDGVIVVRFAGDGTERKLMAEYAPVTKR
jgi:DNA helicase-2/ATP-dependent DNA helicase PcrA